MIINHHVVHLYVVVFVDNMAAKFCQLMKFKSVIKKWRSMGKHNRSISSSAVADIHNSTSFTDDHDMVVRDDQINRSTPPAAGGGHGLQAVYVGKSRRRYLISSDIIDHPLVRELVVRSSSVGCESELSASAGITFDCEVVMFEHLLWMIENSDPLEDHESSIDGDDEHELVDYYVCS
ncbi:auxin-responsive protein SAUR78-like isoform X1 [Papaver somniferum]|uniref:auxin-responsive protein SAUR78-like isoform X1 n=1 Tax=Papaver somniferum TaxID=3469 RepID=UPI000E703261|nr:auxin-responsive protein SAUR78-like isoform X1 [Papaver somniferum]